MADIDILKKALRDIQAIYNLEVDYEPEDGWKAAERAAIIARSALNFVERTN